MSEQMTYSIMTAEAYQDHMGYDRLVLGIYRCAEAFGKQTQYAKATVIVMRMMLTSKVFLAVEHNGSRKYVVGFVRLCCDQGLTAYRGRIEDLVVSEELRRHGLGRRLVDAACLSASLAGCDEIILTSREDRGLEKFYTTLGFTKSETNKYVKSCK